MRILVRTYVSNAVSAICAARARQLGLDIAVPSRDEEQRILRAVVNASSDLQNVSDVGLGDCQIALSMNFARQSLGSLGQDLINIGAVKLLPAFRGNLFYGTVRRQD